MKKNFISILSFTIVSIFAVSIFNISSPAKTANAQLFEEMKDAGLSQIGRTAYGSELPQQTAPEIIAEIIKYALSFLGLIFLILTLYGGFLWMTAGGNDDKISQSKSIVINGVIGLVIILSAYSITYFVLENIIKATTKM